MVYNKVVLFKKFWFFSVFRSVQYAVGPSFWGYFKEILIIHLIFENKIQNNDQQDIKESLYYMPYATRFFSFKVKYVH